MRPFWRLSAAGFAATAIAYGPARMGFGLFLSEFRSAFSLSSGTAGLVSGLGFLGMLLGLIAAYAALSWRGPRLPVLLGLGAATLGTGLVASATGLPTLAVGVFLAMTSAGFSWSPFNNIVNRQVRDDARPAALSVISTGTSLGVAAAGAAALLVSASGGSWRIAWAAFALASALALLANLAGLRDSAGPLGPSTPQPWGQLLRGAAMPLYAIALSYGTTTAVYISFAADRIEQAGGLTQLPAGASSALLFLCFGIFGLVGLATGAVKGLLGLAGLLRALLLASALSLALVALTPSSWAGVAVSASLQGAFVMMMSAVLAFWSERLFPQLPARAFTAALIAVAAGSALGPVAAGFLAGAFGAGTMFLATAAISGMTAAAVLPRVVQERPRAG
jgi:predicted MFS family arabinose efflux permease